MCQTPVFLCSFRKRHALNKAVLSLTRGVPFQRYPYSCRILRVAKGCVLVRYTYLQRGIEAFKGSLHRVCNVLLQIVVANGVLGNLDRSLLFDRGLVWLDKRYANRLYALVGNQRPHAPSLGVASRRLNMDV